MKNTSIYEAMKKADALSKSRDDDFIDMMNKLSLSGRMNLTKPKNTLKRRKGRRKLKLV
jgi:hypothetical protein